MVGNRFVVGKYKEFNSPWSVNCACVCPNAYACVTSAENKASMVPIVEEQLQLELVLLREQFMIF